VAVNLGWIPERTVWEVAAEVARRCKSDSWSGGQQRDLFAYVHLWR